MDPFVVQDISSWHRIGDEQLGSKEKSWFGDPDDVRWLFKVSRTDRGDDWAEKITAELGRRMGLPCPEVELASIGGGKRGTITRSFVPTGAGVTARLVHGNELLYQLDDSYPMGQDRNVQEHTISAVLHALEHFEVDAPREGPKFDDGSPLSASDCFTGYLAFDAWVGNQDRHHENWGILHIESEGSPGSRVLAPSFDHAASLGQTLRDTQRARRLETKDRAFSVEAFARKARSHIYIQGDDTRPATTHDAFAHLALLRPEAATHWRQRIASVTMETIEGIVQGVPAGLMSETTRRFTERILVANRDSLAAQLPE